MKQRGRKSVAAAAPADFQKAKQRPIAPADMLDAEKAVWKRVVAAMPADWFNREHLDLLRSYCEHSVRARKYSRMASMFEAKDVGERIELDDLDRVSRMAEREVRAALALARSMRITHQAQLRSETAATKRDSDGGEPRPWD